MKTDNFPQIPKHSFVLQCFEIFAYSYYCRELLKKIELVRLRMHNACAYNFNILYCKDVVSNTSVFWGVKFLEGIIYYMLH